MSNAAEQSPRSNPAAVLLLNGARELDRAALASSVIDSPRGRALLLRLAQSLVDQTAGRLEAAASDRGQQPVFSCTALRLLDEVRPAAEGLLIQLRYFHDYLALLLPLPAASGLLDGDNGGCASLAAGAAVLVERLLQSQCCRRDQRISILAIDVRQADDPIFEQLEHWRCTGRVAAAAFEFLSPLRAAEVIVLFGNEVCRRIALSRSELRLSPVRRFPEKTAFSARLCWNTRQPYSFVTLTSGQRLSCMAAALQLRRLHSTSGGPRTVVPLATAAAARASTVWTAGIWEGEGYENG